MKGDFSRRTFDPTKDYTRVLKQQGRVDLDADHNEQQQINLYRDETQAKDIIGKTGAPADEAGFELTWDGGELKVSAGRFYVDGIMCEVHDDDFTAPTPTTSGLHLAYLDVWESHVTALEDPEIQEVALGGPDTATRTKTEWRVRTLPIMDPAHFLSGSLADLKENLEKRQVLEEPLALEDGPLDEAALKDLADIDRAIRGLLKSTGCRDFETWATLGGPEAVPAISTGRLTARAEPEEHKDDLCHISAQAGYRGLENHLYRVEIHDDATFKWSRNNGSEVLPIKKIDGSTVIPRDVGPDGLADFVKQPVLLEIVDEKAEAQEVPGQGLFEVVDSPGPEQEIKLNAAPAPTSDAQKIRRWDGTGTIENEVWIPLESGIQIKFDGGQYNPGDYWLIPARAGIPTKTGGRLTGTGDILWPVDETDDPLSRPPDGTKHHYACLALLLADGSGDEISEVYVAEDCRKLFAPLTGLTDFYYLGGDGQEVMPDFANAGSLVPLPQSLRVGVSGPKAPVANAPVLFKLPSLPGGLGSDDESALIVLTEADGVASCDWKLNKVDKVQQVEAVLLDERGRQMYPPIIFNANLSRADQVAYSAECEYLQGATTVQAALDQLCKRKCPDEPAIHVKGVTIGHADRFLHNDTVVQVDEFSEKLRVYFDSELERTCIDDRPTCFVTLHLPFPLWPQHQGGATPLMGHTPLIVAGQAVCLDDVLVEWVPSKQIDEWLNTVLWASLQRYKMERLQVSLTLKGNFIWGYGEDGKTPLYLDGEAFGLQQNGADTTDVDWKSPGDGRKGGDFEMWFWIVPKPFEIDVPVGVLATYEPMTIGVKLMEPAPEGGAKVAIKVVNAETGKAVRGVKIPELIVPAGAREASIEITAERPSSRLLSKPQTPLKIETEYNKERASTNIVFKRSP